MYVSMEGTAILVYISSDDEEDKSKISNSMSTPAVQKVNIDDDDCLVLDGDPENVVISVDDQAPAGSDELLVVGEKGQVACRDYPHSRHLCAKFPFSSSPHENHCNQCHCYVCDSLAPCLKWGTGLSITDHCHATDKSEMWKTLRKNFKLGKTAPSSIPASTNHGASFDATNLLHNHKLNLNAMQQCSPKSILSANQTWSTTTTASTFSSSNLRPQNQASQPIVMPRSSSLNSSLQNQVSRAITISAHSTANLAIPQGANQAHNLASWPIVMPTSSFKNSTIQNQVSRPITNLIPQGANHGRFKDSAASALARQWLGVRNHAIQKERGHGAIGLRPQVFPSSMMSNPHGVVSSAGSTLAMLNNNAGSAPQYGSRYRPAMGFSSNRTTLNGQSAGSIPSTGLYLPQPISKPATVSCVNKNTTALACGSCYVACQNLNQHCQIGSIIKSGGITTRQETCAARKEGVAAFDTSLVEEAFQSISHLQSSTSINQESGSTTTNLGLVDDIKNMLFGEDGSVPVVEDGALACDLSITSPYLGGIDTGMLLIGHDYF